MAKQQRQRHVPTRTCIACRASRPKRDLVRVVRTPEGETVVDESGKRNGRGAYLCRQQSCWERAIKHQSLNRALRVTLSPADAAALLNYAGSLPAQLEPVEDMIPDDEDGVEES